MDSNQNLNPSDPEELSNKAKNCWFLDCAHGIVFQRVDNVSGRQRECVCVCVCADGLYTDQDYFFLTGLNKQGPSNLRMEGPDNVFSFFQMMDEV